MGTAVLRETFRILEAKNIIESRQDTVMVHFPLFCPKCKQENIVTVEGGKITLIEEPDATAQSR